MLELFTGGNIVELIIETLLSIPGVIFAFTVKGFGQALVSKWLGDPTPEENGRLTMNPLAHIDWLGLLFMTVFHFGWTKPLPTNSRNYKHYKRDTVIFSLSGSATLVVSSFVMCLFYVLFSILAYKISGGSDTLGVMDYLSIIFYYAHVFPLFLAIFYLLPLPGLDGYKIITTFTPYKWNTFLYKLERYSIFIFIGFILLMRIPQVSNVVFFPANLLSGLFISFWNLPFSLIFSFI